MNLDSDARIESVEARMILDGRGYPQLEADVHLRCGLIGRAAALTGTSVGRFECRPLYDGDPAHFSGRGVKRAVSMVETVIAPAIKGMDVRDQAQLDAGILALGKTQGNAELGGNCTYSVSLAALKAAAAHERLELFEYIALYLAGEPITRLPFPTTHCFYSMKGKKQVQECSFVPVGADSMEEAAELLVRIYEEIPRTSAKFCGEKAVARHPSTSWQPPSDDVFVEFAIIGEAAERAGARDKIAFAADFAANDLYDPVQDKYWMGDKSFDREAWIRLLERLTENWDFLYIEDPFAENDIDGWTLGAEHIGRTNLIGDDFIATNADRLRQAKAGNCCSGFVFKPNQIGTVTQAVEAWRFAHNNGMLCIPSVRSGGISSEAAADFAVGLGCPAVKNGPPVSGKENIQLNTLLRAASLYPQAKMYDWTEYIRFFH